MIKFFIPALSFSEWNETSSVLLEPGLTTIVWNKDSTNSYCESHNDVIFVNKHIRLHCSDTDRWKLTRTKPGNYYRNYDTTWPPWLTTSCIQIMPKNNQTYEQIFALKSMLLSTILATNPFTPYACVISNSSEYDHHVIHLYPEPVYCPLWYSIKF